MHPGKTGGTSVEHVFIKKFLNKNFTDISAKIANYDIMYGWCKENKLFLHHADLRFYKLKGINYQDYTKYITIRRPYERILSAYYYNSVDKKYDFNTFILEHLEKRLLSNKKGYTIGHFDLQSHFYEDGMNIIKLENFEDDCKRYNIEISKIKHCKTKASDIWNDYLSAYTEKAKDYVYNIYKQDFDTFGYSK